MAYTATPELRADADLIDDHSWWYLGYRATNEEEGRAFVLGYLRAILTNTPFGDTLPLPESLGLESVTRLHIDSDAAATIPFLIERPGHYPPYTGGWVCYLDGHSAFIDYPGKWPMTVEFIRGLEMIDEIGAMVVGEARTRELTPDD